MSKKRSRKKAGQTRFNRQWINEHQAHLRKLFYGMKDKVTGRVLG